MKYSPGFRSSVVRRMLDGSGRSIAEVARETGVSYATIANWKEKYRVGKLDVDDATGATPDQRNPGEKLTLLLAGKSLDEEQKGERENRRLQRELARKEKALAEAAVLLTLKKKFRNLFATEDEET